MQTLEQAKKALEQVSQGHILRFWDRLDDAGKRSLLDQVASLDLAPLPGLVRAYVLAKPTPQIPKSIAPAPYFPHRAGAPGLRWDRVSAHGVGESLIRRGKVGAFVVAGGQGSRLGYNGPKGCLGAGVISGKPLFQLFAEQLLGAKDRYNVRVPWYIMTSPLNHEQTVSFFEANRFFGLLREDVRFFRQGVMPSLDIKSGKVLMSAPGEIATNPDGHGGCIRALHESGSLADMQARGVEHLSYFQVDNPHARVLDPVFVGLHAGAPESSGEMSSKMVPKASADEKVGVFCLADARLEVLEYSDLPPSLSQARDREGNLLYNAGSIAIHLISVEFLRRLATDPKFQLPFHRAEKKVACIDIETGAPVTPTANNAVKLEKFVFDALRMARASIVYETDRVEEFAPIKNATGTDSIESCGVLQTERAARWLESRGVRVPRRPDGTPDCVLEISPRTATSAEELAGVRLPGVIEPGASLLL